MILLLLFLVLNYLNEQIGGVCVIVSISLRTNRRYKSLIFLQMGRNYSEAVTCIVISNRKQKNNILHDCGSDVTA